MYQAANVTAIRVGRNAGDGYGDRIHVEVRYRENDENAIHVHDGFDNDGQAWALAGLIVSAKLGRIDPSTTPFESLTGELADAVRSLVSQWEA